MIRTTKEAKKYVNEQMEGISPLSCRPDLLEKRMNEIIKDLRVNHSFLVHDDINLDPMMQFQGLQGGKIINECKIVVDPRDQKKYFNFTYLQFN